MKKSILLIFILSITFSTYSQNLSVPKFGIKVGTNYTNFNFHQYNYIFLGTSEISPGKAKPESTSNFGVQGGFFVNFKLNANWHYTPYVNYSQFSTNTKINRTFDVDTIRTTGIENNEYIIEYISLDNNFKCMFNDRVSIYLGPSIKYAISNELNKTVVNSPNGLNEDYSGEIIRFNEIDGVIIFGTSLFITENIDVDLNMYIGILEVESNDDGYNRAIQSSSFSIGYTF